MIGFQGMTAGPAAVATLPTQLMARQLTAQADLAKQISFSPSLGQEPGLFSSILDGAFPFVKKIAKPIPPPPDVDGMEDLDEVISFGGRNVPRWLVHSILHAARTTGVDPSYMITLADVESSLSPDAKAPTSSAEGLFQFIDSTWLETVFNHAGDYGFGAVANAIKLVDGEPVVVNEKDRAWIMSLRRDPYFSALMAGELIKDIEHALQTQGERELQEAELYLAHFLGANSAVRFLQALDEKPDMAASKLFPQAAKANSGLFTALKGKRRRPVSVAELYDRIDSKIVRRLDRYDNLAPQIANLNNGPQRTVEASAVQ
jgi:hypothetical protein